MDYRRIKDRLQVRYTTEEKPEPSRRLWLVALETLVALSFRS